MRREKYSPGDLGGLAKALSPESTPLILLWAQEAVEKCNSLGTAATAASFLKPV